MSQIYKAKKKVADDANVDVLSDGELASARRRTRGLTAEEQELYERHLKAMEADSRALDARQVWGR